MLIDLDADNHFRLTWREEYHRWEVVLVNRWRGDVQFLGWFEELNEARRACHVDVANG